MKNTKHISALTLAMLVTIQAAGCAGFGRCAPENCATDKITLTEVNQALASHPELGPPAAINAQVINGVAYLTGQVSTEYEVRSAASIVLHIAGVKDVVNSLTALGNGR